MLLHGLDDVEDGGDAAQRVRDAARAHRLLADDAVRQGDLLVERPPAGAAHADGGEDEVGALERLPQIGGADERRRLLCRLSQLVEHRSDGLKSGRVGVVEAQFGHPPGCLVCDECLEHEGDAESSAAQDGELHTVLISVWWVAHRSTRDGARVVASVMMPSSASTSKGELLPFPGNFSAPASR